MTQIPDLWPATIDVEVLPPAAVFRRQAGLLREHTKGLLEAEVRSFWNKEDKTDRVHEFRIIARPLDGYTYVLFQAWHNKDFVYPVTISFKPWIEQAKGAYRRERYGKNAGLAGVRIEIPVYDLEEPSGLRTAATPSDLIESLGEILTSGHTQSILMSLIARINGNDQSSADPPPSPPAGSGTVAPADGI